MIKVGSINGKPEKMFKDYNEVCDYINAIERKKAIETGEMGWMFIKRPHQTISMLYYASPLWKSRLTDKEREAVEKQVGIIEIKKGSRRNFVQFLNRSCLDIEPLKKNFCHEYGDRHGIEITEFISKKCA